MALALWIVLCAVWICSREYSCKALNDVKSLGTISIAKVGIEGGNQKAVLGGSIKIACTIIDTSGTRPFCRWIKNGIRVSDNGKTLIWNQDGMSPNDKSEKIFLLILKNISVEDEGNYTCAVRGGKPAMTQSKTFTLRTEPCPGGYYCPWRENKKYPCPYGTYTDGSSNGTVLSPRDCLKCPGVTQGTQPKRSRPPAASLGGCPAAFNTCPENYYCYNRTSILPCPRGKYFEWRNATDVSDCKECSRDAGQLEGGSKALIDRCEDLIPSVKSVTYAGKPGNLDIIFGVLGGAVVIVMVIFVFLHRTCGFFSRASHSDSLLMLE